jgi:hypothetical protein
MTAVTCDHCVNMRKNPETGVWACALPEIPAGRGINDTCRAWSCAVCGRGHGETNLRIDGGQRFEEPVTHENCWPEEGR